MVDPDNETIIENPNISVTIAIPPHTVKDKDGNDYAGPISVSEVPAGFTPGSLPDSMKPSRVVTIQPMGLKFAQPAPLTFPNLDHLTRGTEVNFWSMDHATSQFFVAGHGRVSDDGKLIETIDGGIRESSWHFPLPPTPPGCTGGDCPPDGPNDKNSSPLFEQLLSRLGVTRQFGRWLYRNNP